MTDPIVVEARLMGCKKMRRRDGDWQDATFQMHPDDDSYGLFRMPLGTRVALVVTELHEHGDDDDGAAEPPDTPSTPEAPEAPTEAEPAPAALTEADRKLIRQAGMLPKEPNFRTWLACANLVEAAQAIRTHCGVKSRADIRSDQNSGRHMARLINDYRDSNLGMTEADQERQMERRP